LTRTRVRFIIEHVFGVYLRRRVAFLAVLATLFVGGLRYADASSGARPVVRYTVQPGDSLWGIAATRYAGDDPRSAVDTIATTNHLVSDTIMPGQTLLLP